MQKYETTIVLDATLKSEDMQALLSKIETFITNNGGTISLTEEWGKKRLAYEINRKQYGHYYHIQFEAPGSLLKLLEDEYRLAEPILRYLTVKAAPHILRAQARKAEKAALNPTPEVESPASEPVAAAPAEAAEPEAPVVPEVPVAPEAPVEPEAVAEAEEEAGAPASPVSEEPVEAAAEPEVADSGDPAESVKKTDAADPA